MDLSTKCVSTRFSHVEPIGVCCHTSGLSLPLRLTVGGRPGRFPVRLLWICPFVLDSGIQVLADLDLAGRIVVYDQNNLVVNSVGNFGSLALVLQH